MKKVTIVLMVKGVLGLECVSAVDRYHIIVVKTVDIASNLNSSLIYDETFIDTISYRQSAFSERYCNRCNSC